MKFRCVCVLVALLSSTLFAKDTVRLSKFPENRNYEYKMAVLNRILSSTQASFGEYEIKFTAPHLTVKRGFQAVNSGEPINVFMAITTEAWEEKTLPIRIPVRRGILSERLVVSAKENLHLFTSIRSIEEIKKRRAGLKMGWATTGVLQQGGFNTFEISSLDRIYEMISKGKVDFTLRGPNEVFGEIATRSKTLSNLVVVPDIAISLPAPYYIFVSPSEARLAKRLEEGLEKMVANGSLKALFYKYFGAELSKANMQSRMRLPVENQELPPLTPLGRKELWYFHDEGAH